MDRTRKAYSEVWTLGVFGEGESYGRIMQCGRLDALTKKIGSLEERERAFQVPVKGEYVDDLAGGANVLFAHID